MLEKRGPKHILKIFQIGVWDIAPKRNFQFSKTEACISELFSPKQNNMLLEISKTFRYLDSKKVETRVSEMSSN